MLSKPTAVHLRAALQTAAQPWWRDVESMIDSEIDFCLTVLSESRDVPTLHQLQGRVQALRSFKLIMANAMAMLEKVERPSGGARGI